MQFLSIALLISVNFGCCCVGGTAAIHWQEASSKVQLRQKNSGERTFIDQFGRELFFHGFNAVVKGPPWVPEVGHWDGDISLVEKDFEDLQSIGQNVVRLGTMWPGVEPEDGKFDDEYIDKIRWIIRTAAQYGIYVLLDMHQDVLSENFCGEGAPDWLIRLSKGEENATSFPSPKNDNETFTDVAADGFPLRSDCNKDSWPNYYGTYDCSRAFEALYSTEEQFKDRGVLDRWTRFWVKVAQEFKDEPNVLGYELINEPWPGDVFQYPSLLIPGVADEKRLQPAYDALSEAIRGIDRTTLIFFAAITWDDIIPAGFTAAPGGIGEADRAVFAYHYYEPPQEVQATYFHTRVNDAKRLQVGSMVTEFERPNNNDDFDTDPFFETAAAMDKYLQSWMMWELKTFCKETDESLASDSQNAAYGSCKTGYGSTDYLWDSSGLMNPNTSKKLARTYASAVAGNTTSMSFDHRSGYFQLQFSIDLQCSKPTVIFAQQSLIYPNGIEVKSFPVDQLDIVVLPAENKVQITPLYLSTLNTGDLVTIIIEGK